MKRSICHQLQLKSLTFSSNNKHTGFWTHVNVSNKKEAIDFFFFYVLCSFVHLVMKTDLVLIPSEEKVINLSNKIQN